MKTTIIRIVSLVLMVAITICGIEFLPTKSAPIEVVPTQEETTTSKTATTTMETTEKEEETTEEESTTEALTNTSVNGIDIINVLLQHVDKTPYVRGGYNFESGTDCCGMISLAYAEYGVNIADDCTTMVNRPTVSMGEMLPGDVIGTSEHVCIFAGWTEGTEETIVGYNITPITIEGGLDALYEYSTSNQKYEIYVKISDFEYTIPEEYVQYYKQEYNGEYYLPVWLLSNDTIWKSGHENTYYIAEPVYGKQTYGVIIELLPGGNMAISEMKKSKWNLPAAHRICTNTAPTNYFQGNLSNYHVWTKTELLSVWG